MKAALSALIIAASLAPKLSGQEKASNAVITVEAVPADKPRYYGVNIDALPVIGEKKEGTIRVTAIGKGLRTPAILHLNAGSSLADALKSGVELTRFATSRFIVWRGEKQIHIHVGGSHGFSDGAKDTLPLIHLQDNDVVYVFEVSPY